MDRTLVLLRLGCLVFGALAGILLPDKAIRQFFPKPKEVGAQLMRLMISIAKTVVCCAVAVVTTPAPASISILYAGLGLLAAHILLQHRPAELVLPVICTWLILFLPFTGVLACLGGGLLVLAADVPGVAGLAILVLGAPMALLQFGAEGGLVLLGAAALLCTRQVLEWRGRRIGLYPG